MSLRRPPRAAFPNPPRFGDNPRTGWIMSPELEGIRTELEAVSRSAQRLCAGLDERQLSWRPQPGRWSLAENLVHLNVANQLYLTSIDQSIDDARRRGLVGSGPFRQDFVGRWFIRMVEPPFRIRTKAPQKIVPLLQGPATETLPQFLRCQERVVERLARAEGLDLERARLVSPFASLLRMNLLSAFGVVTSHERRHLFQMEHIRRELAAAHVAGA